ncbi:MAG: disulfide bond formation protein B [Verrucomicrobia bacterium]|nr:disulfide bond formation protein B [Verrucomicrobiota bacterium]
MWKTVNRYSFFLAWLMASIATLVSLYLSEIAKLTPCKYCWYERVFLFPLAVILFPMVLKNRRDFIPYILPLTVMGFVISVYHFVLSYMDRCPYLCRSFVLSWVGPFLFSFLFILLMMARKDAKKS